MSDYVCMVVSCALTALQFYLYAVTGSSFVLANLVLCLLMSLFVIAVVARDL